MSLQERSKSNLILRSLGFRLWLPSAVGTILTLVALGYLVVRDPQWIGLAIAMALLAVAALVSLTWYISRRVLQPLNELRHSAAALASGQLDHRIHLATGDEIELLAGEFNQMAASLQRGQEQLAATAREETQHSQLLSLSADITRMISSSLDLNATLNTILASVQRLVPYDLAEICLWEPDKGVLRSRALGADPKYAVYATTTGGVYTLNEGLTGWIARQRMPLLIEDLTQETRVKPKVDVAEFPIRAHAGVPLLIGNQLVGTLELASYTPGAFTATHISTLQAVANQAAVAIQNANLFQETRQRAEDMATLREAAIDITSHLGLGRILQLIVERATALLHAESGVLYRVDVDRQCLNAFVSYRLQRDLSGMTVPFGLDLAGRVARKRQPTIVNDYGRWDGRTSVYDGESVAAAISVPLIWQDELLGVLDVLAGPNGHGGQRQFGDEDLRLITLFGSQAAVALQNADLYEQVTRRMGEMAILHDTAVDIASRLEPEELLETMVRRAVELLDARGGALYRYNSADQTSRLIVSYNMGRDYRGVVIGRSEGLIGQLMSSREPAIVNDYQNWPGRSSQFAEASFTAVMGAPLACQDRVLGALLVLDDAKRRVFNLSDLRLITLFASQAAVALQNADLYAESRRRATEMTTLTEIGRLLSSTLDVNKLLRLVYEQTQRVMYADNMFVALYDAERAEVEFAFSVNQREVQLGSRRSAGRGLTGHVIRTREPLFLPGTVEAFLDEHGIEKIGPLASAWMGVPMMVGDRMLGVISVQHYEDPHAYDAMHLELLQAIAAQAATALENARLYQLTDVRLQHRVDELTALDSITRELNSTLEMSHIFDLVLTGAMQTTAAQYASIYLLDGVKEPDVLHLRAMRGYDTLPAPAAQQIGLGIIGQVVATGQAVVVADVTQDGDYLQVVPDVRSELCVPISYAGSVVGAINLESTTAEAFNDEHLRFVSALASQAAIAIGNAQRLEEQMLRGELLRRRADQFSNLFEISQAFRSDRPMEDVLSDIAHAIQETVGFDVAVISLLEGEPPVQRRVAAAGVPVTTFEEMKRSRPAWSRLEGIMQDQFRLGQCYYFPAEASEVTASLETYFTSRLPGGTRRPGCWHPDDLLIVPLRGSGGRVLGVISVDDPRDGHIPDHATIETLELFGNQAAIIVENARLFTDLQRRIDELMLINEISRSISGELDMDLLLTTVVDAAARLLSGARSTVFLSQDSEGVFAPAKAHGFDMDQIAHLRFQTGQGLIGWAAEHKQGLVVRDASKDARFVPDPASAGVCSVIVVPLLVGEQVIGVLSADRPGVGDFNETDLVLLSTLSDQASVAISNARLFTQIRGLTLELEQRVQERTGDLRQAVAQLTLEHDRVETLFRITSELSASLDLDRVLNRALSLVVEAIGAPRGSIMLVDSQSDMLIHRAALGRHPTYGPAHLPPGGAPTKYRRGEGLAGWVIQKRQPAIVEDVVADDRWIKYADKPTDYHAALAVPLMTNDDVLGALILLHPDVGFFSEDHLRLVEAAARQVAIAINNAELYRLIRDQAERVGSMLRAQQEEASKSQAILEAVADGVMVANTQGRVMLFNAAAERILGASRYEIIDRATEDLVGLYGTAGAAWINQVRQWLSSASSRAEVPSLEQRLRIEGRHINMHIAPVTNGDEYLGTVSIFRDVTKEVEVDQAKTEFVSTVSHELRTPMTSIKGYADLMLLGAAGSMNDDQRRFLSIIKANADRLSVLVNDLLDISRIEGGRVELDVKPIRLESMVDQVASSLRSKIEEKGLSLSVNLPADLPAVLADRDRTIQILTNLVGNAYQYTLPGGSITVTAQRMGDQVQVDVTDTGIGIAPPDQAKVFDRFFRADDPDVQEFAGTGLGLAIVKNLVDMLHGRIWLESEVGKGSTFSFTLPAAQPEEAPVPPKPMVAAPEQPVVTMERKNGDRRYILIVEDDPNIAELIGHHLAEGGYRVATVGRAEDALQLARREPPDLITLDIYLPGTDGFELLQTLKSDEATADIPVVIVSVVADEKQGLRLGAVDYVTKPIDQRLLVDTVGRVLSGAGKVLVVDDDRDTQGLLRRALSTTGIEVRTTASGRTALQLARREKPDLILLDLKLPGGVDGYQVLTQLKQDEETAGIPVIVITGSLTDEEVKQSKVLSLGAARFVTKPFEIDDLIGEIRQFMAGVSQATGEAQ